jgi:hypothetical protein
LDLTAHCYERSYLVVGPAHRLCPAMFWWSAEGAWTPLVSDPTADESICIPEGSRTGRTHSYRPPARKPAYQNCDSTPTAKRTASNPGPQLRYTRRQLRNLREHSPHFSSPDNLYPRIPAREKIITSKKQEKDRFFHGFTSLSLELPIASSHGFGERRRPRDGGRTAPATGDGGGGGAALRIGARRRRRRRSAGAASHHRRRR